MRPRGWRPAVEGSRSGLLVGRRGDAEPSRHWKPRADELAEVRRLAPHHRQQLRIDAAKIEDEFIVNDV
ncbi:MAG: hypothetical protein M3Y48_04725 [Actinomycetota bacterium]|nr:hypothetical protein [Actinomycetota bacterium]